MFFPHKIVFDIISVDSYGFNHVCYYNQGVMLWLQKTT